MDKRPVLNKEISVEDYKNFYWYKEELIEFCRSENISKSGGKIELANRIIQYLQTGEEKNSKKKTSEKKPNTKAKERS